MIGSQSLTVAAVQFTSSPLDPETNRVRAAKFVAEAQARGASLVVLPELFNTGYVEHAALHDLAEDDDGPTVRSLRDLSTKHGVYLAGGFAERHRGHVYDSVAFCTPRGELSIYRKRHLIFWEHFYFRAGREPLIVETELGRIGFAICADMMYDHIWSGYRGQIDLAVVSAAWPCEAAGATRRVGWLLRTSWQLAGDIPLKVARDLDVTVVLANQWGPCAVRVPMMGPASVAKFAGRSGIFNGRAARVSAELAGEGVVIGQVPVRKERPACVTLSA